MRFKNFVRLGGLCAIFAVVIQFFVIGNVGAQCTPGHRDTGGGGGGMGPWIQSPGSYVPAKANDEFVTAPGGLSTDVGLGNWEVTMTWAAHFTAQECGGQCGTYYDGNGCFWMLDGTGGVNLYFVYNGNQDLSNYDYDCDATFDSQDSNPATPDQNDNAVMRHTASNITILMDGTERWTGSPQYNNLKKIMIHTSFNANGDTPLIHNNDYIYVRQYASPGPAWGNWGAEEAN